MGQGEHLALPGENHLMLPHNGAAPHRVQTNLLFLPLFPLGVAVVHILHGVFPHLVDGVGNHQSGAAGGVNLLVVVHLHNLHVEAVAQNSLGLFGQLDEQVHAQGHIPGVEQGQLFGGLLDFLGLLGAVACGAQHRRRARVAAAVLQNGGQGRGVREIHHHLGLLLHIL